MRTQCEHGEHNANIALSAISNMRSRLLARLRSEDGGGGFIFIFLSIPLIMLCFGLAIDGAQGRYMRTTVQGNVSTSVAAGATQLNLNRGTINLSNARQVTVELYSLNRRNFNRGVRCATAADAAKYGGTLKKDADGCGWILKSFTRSEDRRTLEMHVIEFAKTNWLSGIGIKEFPMNVVASSRIAQN